MQKVELKNWPIRNEKSLIDTLRAGELDKISDYPQDGRTKNYCKITIWSCNRDRDWGYVFMYTTQKRITKNSSGKAIYKPQTRLVFSDKFEKSQLEMLLSLAKT